MRRMMAVFDDESRWCSGDRQAYDSSQLPNIESCLEPRPCPACLGTRCPSVTRSPTLTERIAMKVKELMSIPIEWVHPSLPIREAARKMRASNVGCMPVCEERRLLGILTDRDIVCRLVANDGNADRMHVYDLMTGNVVACLED